MAGTVSASNHSAGGLHSEAATPAAATAAGSDSGSAKSLRKVMGTASVTRTPVLVPLPVAVVTPDGQTLLVIEALREAVTVADAVPDAVAVRVRVALVVAVVVSVADGEGLGGTSTASDPPGHATTMLPPRPMAGELLMALVHAANDQRSAPFEAAAAQIFPSVPPVKVQFAVLLGKNARTVPSPKAAKMRPSSPMAGLLVNVEAMVEDLPLPAGRLLGDASAAGPRVSY